MDFPVRAGNLLLNLTIHCQTTNAGIQYQIILEEVTFSGNFDIKNDVDYTDMDYYAPPHWSVMYQPDEQKPIAYVSGQKPEVTAKFIFSCPTLPNSIYIKGDQPDGYHFEYKQVSPIPLGNDQYELIYPLTESVISFLLNRVDYFDDFVIDWKIGFDDPNAPYCPVSQSENRLYVTHKAPIPEGNLVGEPGFGYFWFHTLLEISCREAKGEDMPNKIQDEILGYLKNLNTKKVDGTLLTYYKNWGSCVAVTTEGLLSADDGQCGSWARLFIDLLKIQGIDDPNYPSFWSVIQGISVGVPLTPDPQGFIVKDWGLIPGSLITQLGFVPPINYSYVGIPHQVTPFIDDLSYFYNNNMYNWHYGVEVVDQSGIPGQGVSNPLSFFGNHQLAKINGNYFDPSYGEEYSSLSDMESKAVSAFFIVQMEFVNELSPSSPFFQIDVNGDGYLTNPATVDVIYFSDQLPLFELIELPIPYSYDH